MSHVRSEAAEGFTTDGRWSERAFAETLDKGATSVVFTPDGSHLVASGPGGDVGIWSVETRQLLKKKLIHASMPSGTAVSFDGTRAAISYLTGQVRLIRLPGLGDGKLRDPKRMDGIASAVEFSRVQPHLAIGGPGLVKVWDWQAERDLGTLERHSETVHSISFDASPGSIVTCDSECAHVWDSISLRHIRAIRPTVGPAEMVMSVDGVLAAFRTIGGGVEVYEFESGELVSRSKHSGDWAGVSAFAFTRDGQLLSADSQGGLHLWNPQNLVAGEAVGIHPGKAHVVTCSPVEDIVVSCARRKRLGLVGDDYPRFWYRRPNATTGLEPDA